jgi:hypothetical protein
MFLDCISFYNYIQDSLLFMFQCTHLSPGCHPKFPRFELSEELLWDLAEARFGPKSRQDEIHDSNQPTKSFMF